MSNALSGSTGGITAARARATAATASLAVTCRAAMRRKWARSKHSPPDRVGPSRPSTSARAACYHPAFAFRIPRETAVPAAPPKSVKTSAYGVPAAASAEPR